MTGTAPDLSVIIPTHNRRAALIRALEALAAQTLVPTRFEVVVVMDAVTDDTPAALAARTWPFDLSAIVPPGRGAAGARNAGAGQARGDRIVFMDDDMVPAPGFLAAHLHAAEGGTKVVVIGHSAPRMVDRGWSGQLLERWWTAQFQAMTAPDHRFSHLDVMSGNLSLPRALFLAAGGFDETLPVREDYELGYRLLCAGATLRFAAGALAWHHDASTASRNLMRAGTEGRADVMVARKHPELFDDLKAAGMSRPTVGGRMLRRMLFGAPLLGNALFGLTGALLPVLRGLGLRTRWQQLNDYRRAFAYHRGVAREAGSPAAFDRLAAEARRVRPDPAPFAVDVLGDLEAARAEVDRRAPSGIRLCCGAAVIGHLPDDPGAEPLARRHLDGLLDRTLYRWAPARRLSADLPPLPRDLPDWIGALPVRAPEHTASLAELDLADWNLTAKEVRGGYPLRILVRRGATPLGWVTLAERLEPGTFWDTLRDHVLGDADISSRALRALLVPEQDPAPMPPISVVVCTRDRTDNLARCLTALRALEYPDYQILVVDNAPATNATRALVASLPGVDYTCEPRPGLDWARNHGLAQAAHDIVAFTDDDTMADRHWLRGIAGAFADPDVGLVTGLVAPMKLDTPARTYFEDVYGGMGKGFDAFLRTNDRRATDLLWASEYGVGANMAFRRAVLARTGPFDPGLDVGTPTRGGGDIEMFHRAVARGVTLAYQPAAFVWHEHRADVAGLHRQLADNGSGFGAYLLTCARNRTVPLPAILVFALRDWVGRWMVRRMVRPGGHSRGLVAAEVTGLLKAVHGYRKARTLAARSARGAPDQATPVK